MKAKTLLFLCATAVLLSVPNVAFGNPLPVNPPPEWTAKVRTSGYKKLLIVTISASGYFALTERRFPVASTSEVVVEVRQLNRKELDRIYSLIFVAIDKFRLRPPNGSILDAGSLSIEMKVGQRSMEISYYDLAKEADLAPKALRLRKALLQYFANPVSAR